MVCARIAQEYGDLLAAGLARLQLLYGARIAALAMCGRHDRRDAIAALQAERDAALQALRRCLLLEKEHALKAARAQLRARRFQARIASAADPLPRRPVTPRPPTDRGNSRHQPRP
jgi:hypothetical protein